uniref:Uncharacterized protein n=1 Tax=Arundo donax TaxID=35708 RepID=A0A0A9FD79_ARUDO
MLLVFRAGDKSNNQISLLCYFSFPYTFSPFLTINSIYFIIIRFL